MSFYKYLFSANYRNFFRNLKRIAKSEKRCFLALLIKSVYLMLRYGYGMADFVNYELYKKNKAECLAYVSTKEENTFYEKVSPSAYKKRYTVKPAFLADFAAYTKRDFIVPAEAGYEATAAFLERHSVFMSKPYDGLAGHDVTKEYTADITDKKAFYDRAVENRLFFEELVRQHPDLNVLCPASVNTMRVMTFNDHGIPRILWMGLRVGNGVNAVDNFHAKGMGVNIDVETGKLCGDGIDKDLNHFSEHPVTHVRYDGFQIPYFAEAKEMVLKAALESDKILVVGWDVAISENGPVIIEGNRRPGFDLPQVLAGRGLREIVDSVLNSLS